jgi:hypothetical protein
MQPEALVRRATLADGPMYRDEADPEVVLPTLEVEDFEREQNWFCDERFTAAVARAEQVGRDVPFASAKI